MVTQKFITRTLNIIDDIYPPALRTIAHPPKKLFVKGSFDFSAHNSYLAIVGSRKMTSYGNACLTHFFKDLNRDIVIVSGFMRGVDLCAHMLALEYGLPTIAVLPCGIERVYPDYPQIAEQMLTAGGLLVSEYPGDLASQDWMFVKRNRIVAGLCNVLLLVEAGLKSGSLLTYNYAKSFHKNVVAIPGEIFAPNSAGICQVLRDSAKAVDSGCQINELFGLQTFSDVYNSIEFTTLQKGIINHLKTTPSNCEELCLKMNITQVELNQNLTFLEVNGLVSEINGIIYAV